MSAPPDMTCTISFELYSSPIDCDAATVYRRAGSVLLSEMRSSRPENDSGSRIRTSASSSAAVLTEHE